MIKSIIKKYISKYLQDLETCHIEYSILNTSCDIYNTCINKEYIKHAKSEIKHIHYNYCISSHNVIINGTTLYVNDYKYLFNTKKTNSVNVEMYNTKVFYENIELRINKIKHNILYGIEVYNHSKKIVCVDELSIADDQYKIRNLIIDIENIQNVELFDMVIQCCGDMTEQCCGDMTGKCYDVVVKEAVLQDNFCYLKNVKITKSDKYKFLINNFVYESILLEYTRIMYTRNKENHTIGDDICSGMRSIYAHTIVISNEFCHGTFTLTDVLSCDLCIYKMLDINRFCSKMFNTAAQIGGQNGTYEKRDICVEDTMQDEDTGYCNATNCTRTKCCNLCSVNCTYLKDAKCSSTSGSTKASTSQVIKIAKLLQQLIFVDTKVKLIICNNVIEFTITQNNKFLCLKNININNEVKISTCLIINDIVLDYIVINNYDMNSDDSIDFVRYIDCNVVVKNIIAQDCCIDMLVYKGHSLAKVLNNKATTAYHNDLNISCALIREQTMSDCSNSSVTSTAVNDTNHYKKCNQNNTSIAHTTNATTSNRVSSIEIRRHKSKYFIDITDGHLYEYDWLVNVCKTMNKNNTHKNTEVIVNLYNIRLHCRTVYCNINYLYYTTTHMSCIFDILHNNNYIVEECTLVYKPKCICIETVIFNYNDIILHNFFEVFDTSMINEAMSIFNDIVADNNICDAQIRETKTRQYLDTTDTLGVPYVSTADAHTVTKFTYKDTKGINITCKYMNMNVYDTSNIEVYSIHTNDIEINLQYPGQIFNISDTSINILISSIQIDNQIYKTKHPVIFSTQNAGIFNLSLINNEIYISIGKFVAVIDDTRQKDVLVDCYNECMKLYNKLSTSNTSHIKLIVIDRIQGILYYKYPIDINCKSMTIKNHNGTLHELYTVLYTKYKQMMSKKFMSVLYNTIKNVINMSTDSLCYADDWNIPSINYRSSIGIFRIKYPMPINKWIHKYDMGLAVCYYIYNSIVKHTDNEYFVNGTFAIIQYNHSTQYSSNRANDTKLKNSTLYCTKDSENNNGLSHDNTQYDTLYRTHYNISKDKYKDTCLILSNTRVLLSTHLNIKELCLSDVSINMNDKYFYIGRIRVEVQRKEFIHALCQFLC